MKQQLIRVKLHKPNLLLEVLLVRKSFLFPMKFIFVKQVLFYNENSTIAVMGTAMINLRSKQLFLF